MEQGCFDWNTFLRECVIQKKYTGMKNYYGGEF